MGADKAFLDLVDYERIIPKVWGILGWNIYLYHSHLIITEQTEGTFEPNGKTFGWHQDSGRLNFDMEADPRPRISLKVGYFVTDLSEPGRGNFWIIPGSHLRNEVAMPSNGLGSARRRHSGVGEARHGGHFRPASLALRNDEYSPIVRKAMFYGYGYRWIRPRDRMTIPAEWYEVADPIRKQLLGHTTSNFGYSSPKDEDVPLKIWLEQHQPEIAAR